MPLKKKGNKGPLSPEEEAAKQLKELRDSLGPLSGLTALFCTDACLHRYLRANNWSHKKSRKMLKETMKWRALYRPEEIKWEAIGKEAETGKIYRADFCDREGRSVLIMRPGAQNTNQLEGQIKYLVYCMENAIVNLPPDQEQMVWLVDFEGWNLSMIPVMTARETANVLQNHYPERLAYAILYNPPKFFEGFFNIVKPFLDPKTQKKVKFVYPNEEESVRLMETCFDTDKLESVFGGKSASRFDKDEYANKMREDDLKTASFWQSLPAANGTGGTIHAEACSNGVAVT
ncbi:hypothetical protein GOP47_0012151 [Adiantum capillus-veneris]|uniref:CRAL-TRIO domain-containing protein n=1 Tax=Adiantum capillus-veneris TaxID=13818 RepID=A0A9D4UQ61_ADICA|nr:hypothetical protein GOP47_0012151 [Adiantum capillus-veneris]